jgi:putative oxidoreductase
MRTRDSRDYGRFGVSALVGLLFVVFAAAGAVKFVPIDFEVRNFAHFGYAPWFMTLIGIVEAGGAVMLLWRPSRLTGALLLATVMVGAATSHLRAGDGIGTATPAVVLFVLLVVVAATERRSGAALMQMRPLRRPA